MTQDEIVDEAQRLMMRRWRSHVSASSKLNRRFMNAIAKYGTAAFTHEVIEVCATPNEAKEREIHWIAKFETFSDTSKGYNMTSGGDDVVELTPEVRQRQRDATRRAMWRQDVRVRHLAAQASTTSRLRKSVAIKASWQCELVRENHRRGSRAHHRSMSHRIEQYKGDNLVAVHDSICAAARNTGVPKSSILANLSGKLKHAGGFHWIRC